MYPNVPADLQTMNVAGCQKSYIHTQTKITGSPLGLPVIFILVTGHAGIAEKAELFKVRSPVRCKQVLFLLAENLMCKKVDT